MTYVYIYQGRKYINCMSRNNVIEIVSDKKEDETYDYYRDIKGNIDKERYCKRIDEKELDDYYKLNYKVVYRGYEFVPMNVSKSVLKFGRVYIVTNDCELREKLELEVFDKMAYGRFVLLEEIEDLIVEKTYLTGDKKGQMETWKTNYIEYVSNVPDVY